MDKVRLSDIAYYATERADKSVVTADNFVSTDSMLPNVGGVICSEYFDEDASSIAYRENDILLSNIRPYYKKAWLANRNGGCCNDVLVVRPNEGVDPKFLFAALSTDMFFDYVTKGAKGTKMPRGDKNHIMEYPILRLDNEALVGSLLMSIYEKIANNKRIIEELESTARLVYDYWFTQFDFPNENGKPYRSSGGKMVWDDDLKREIPEGWQSTQVGDITHCLDSQRIPLSSQERDKIKPGEIPYYGATGIMDYVNEFIFDGDYVLVAEDGSVMDDVGLPIVQRVSGKAWINNHAHVLEPSKGHCCRLLMMILKDIPVMKIKTGSIQMKINQDNLNNATIVDIPDALIEKMNEIVSPIDSQILCLQENIERLTSLRDWLLPMLMNGQVQLS